MTTVSVMIERRDLVRLTTHNLVRARGNQMLFAILAIAIGATIIGRRGLPDSMAEGVAQLVTFVVFWGAAVLLALAISQLCIFLYSSQQNGVLGLHSYTLRDDGLLEVTAANETLLRWGGAIDLRRSEEYLWLQVSPGLFHVFPRRCFESQDSFEQFWQGLQGLVPNNAHQRAGAR
jgi:hypothetical protein